MNIENQNKPCWAACTTCYGRGKISQRTRKMVRLKKQINLEKTSLESLPSPVHAAQQTCPNCSGTGIVPTTHYPKADQENYPHVAIVGGGIGGVALAIACLHRGIPFTLYERDANFSARAQGYGLTLQQASNAIKGLGLSNLSEGVNSTRHVVHRTNGEVIVEWGMRLHNNTQGTPKRTNIHIARQSLRLAMLESLEGQTEIQWGHQFMGYKKNEDNTLELNFMVDGKPQQSKADLLVGADGIRSVVRSLLFGETSMPLNYLGCMVILGICPLSLLQGVDSPLLDGATVFQTVDGHNRIYVMPYTDREVMWQFSFPISEEEAKALSALGPQALKDEALRRAPWHTPNSEMLQATPVDLISGYPAYDRALLEPHWFSKAGTVTLLGDAAHPMSPFKGQGANQALLDALSLARGISKGCRPHSNWRVEGLRKNVLHDFETEMLERSAVKVKDSAEAVKLLHSNIVLREGDGPKGRSLK